MIGVLVISRANNGGKNTFVGFSHMLIIMRSC